MSRALEKVEQSKTALESKAVSSRPKLLQKYGSVQKQKTIQFFAKVGIASALNIEWDLVNLLTMPPPRENSSLGSKKRRRSPSFSRFLFAVRLFRKTRIHKVNGLFRYFSGLTHTQSSTRVQ